MEQDLRATPICMYLGRRSGGQRAAPAPEPHGAHCCYARLPQEDVPALQGWLRAFLGNATPPPCIPIGRPHQAEYCLTAAHLRCKLYNPPSAESPATNRP